jgi:hypothetical protein
VTGRLTFATSIRLAVGDLRAQPLRTLLAIVVLAPLAASWFLLASVAGALDDLGVVGQARNVIVTDTDVYDLANISLGAAELTTARRVAGNAAESVTPLVLRLVEVDGRVLQLRAADPADWARVNGVAAIDGVLPDPAADEIAVTSAVSAATGWQLGDSVRVFGTTFTVTALLEGSGSKVASLWLPLARAEALFDRPGEFQFAVVRVKVTADPDDVRARLRAAFPGSLVLDESAIQADATRGIRSLGDVALVFTALGVIGLAVGSANATALALAERPRTVGLLRVVGFAPRSVRAVIAARALLLTAAATAAALAVVWPVVARHGSFVLRSYTIEPSLPPATVLIGFALSLCSAWVGATVAGRRALREPVRVLLEA